MVDVKKFEQHQIKNLLALLDKIFNSGGRHDEIRDVFNVLNLAMRRTLAIFKEDSEEASRDKEFNELISHMKQYQEKVVHGDEMDLVSGFLHQFVEVLQEYYRFVDKDRKSVEDLCNVFRIVTEIYLHLDFDDEDRKEEVLIGIHELVDEWFSGNITPPSSEEELPPEGIPDEDDLDLLEWQFETIVIKIEGQVAYITLNRPEQQNSLNKQMLEELAQIFDEVSKNSLVRVVVLTGHGKAFCNGFDFNEIEKVYHSEDEAQLYVMRFNKMLQTIYSFPKPLIVMVNGDASGSGIGLVAIADIVLAEEHAEFCFPETRWGVVPAIISPFVMEKIGATNTRRYFLTGEKFDVQIAKDLGLVTETGSFVSVRSACRNFITHLLAGGPAAQTHCKKLIKFLTQDDMYRNLQYTSELFKEMMASDESREGIRAFQLNSPPSWLKDV